ncbi:MAG: WD40 repeat domain-containing protein, partial [Chloroflexi bacterium]|nr:WD40 repeat domain-containing protein [Chloroflexota bacterium]
VAYDLASGTESLSIPYARQAETIFPAGTDARGYSQLSLARSSDLLLIYQNCNRTACRDMDEMVRIVDLARPGAELARFETPFWFATASGGDLSPDGRMVAVSGLWNGEVRVWSTQDGQLLMRLQGHQGLVYQAVFSPDGSRLATVSADGTARLWDSASGKLLHTLTGHHGWVLRAAFSPDGARLITSGEDNSLRLWDVATGEELGAFPNPKPEYIVDGLWFTAENTLLLRSADLGEACAGCHSTAFRLDLESESVTVLAWEHLLITAAPTGDWLLRYGSGDQRALSVGRLEAGQLVDATNIPLTALNDSQEIAFSPDGRWIYTFNANGLNVIDRASGEQIALAANYLGIQTSGNGRLEAAPDGRFLVDFTGGNVVLWGIPGP